MKTVIKDEVNVRMVIKEVVEKRTVGERQVGKEIERTKVLA